MGVESKYDISSSGNNSQTVRSIDLKFGESKGKCQIKSRFASRLFEIALTGAENKRRDLRNIGSFISPSNLQAATKTDLQIFARYV